MSTPRTDARIFRVLSDLQSGAREVVDADFARELEDGISEEIQKWIPVSERMPGADVTVLAYWPLVGYTGFAAYWADEGWAWVAQDEAQLADADPSHWMHLPEIPK